MILANYNFPFTRNNTLYHKKLQPKFCIILLILLCSSFRSESKDDGSVDHEPLDVILREHGLKALLSQQQRRHRSTGTLYEIKLPASLSGINVSYVRLRSKTLWRKGANFSSFQIPSRTLPMPYVKRIVIMYQDLGNLSSQFYNHTVPGYSLASSVIGFRVYDASNLAARNVRKLDFNTSDHASISVRFQDLKFSKGARCVSVGGSDYGEFSDLGDVSFGNVCYTRSYGQFLVVIPNYKKKGELVWEKWGVGVVVLVTVIVVSFVGIMIVKMMKVKRLDEMEMQMEEGSEDLETVWIGYSKMPCATVTRTQADLENAGRPT